MRHWPLYATYVKYPRYHDRLNDNSPAGRQSEVRDLQRLMRRLKIIRRSALPGSGRITWDVLQWQIAMMLERHRQKFHQWGGFFNFGVDHMDGIHTWVPSVVELAQPMSSARDAAALLRRLEALPEYFRHHMEGLKEGLREGRIAARVPVDRIIAQLEEMIAAPADRSPYAAAVQRLPERLRRTHGSRILSAVERCAVPSYRRYLEFLQSYRRRARPDEKPGICFLPGGKEAYRHLIRFHASADLSPRQIHRIGLGELESIHEEMRAIARRMGHRGGIASFMDQVRRNPRNFYRSREDILQSARSLVAETYKRLPRFFGTLPETPLVVKRIERYKEKNDAGARYFSPPEDLSRPGIYYVNTHEPASRPKFSMAALTAHEGVPGHHLQIALAAENKTLPTFQRFADSTAFIEGWALYAERLAGEMGLYKNDLSKIGMLSNQAFRACRLAVDTGLHALGWSRGKAAEFMAENTPMSKAEITAEVDRYMIWPGQALAYMIGQRAIAELRREMERRLGPAFDLRAFHDAVLENGPLPLPVMRQAVFQALA